MSRRNRLLLWLAGIITLLGLVYASLPWLLTSVAKYSLAAQGLRNVRLSVDYPRWRGIRLQKLSFTATAGGQGIRVQLPAAEVEYHLSGLLAGRVDHIRIPNAEIHIQPTAGSTPSGQSPAALPLAALVSGQWLAQLPISQLSLDRLNATWQVATDTVYALRLSAHLKNAQLQLSGDISVPPLPKPVAFSVNAGSTGEARLIFSSGSDTAKPLLAVAVTSVDIKQEPLKVAGEMQAMLNRIAPLLTPWLPQLKQISDIEGELDSKWQAHLSNSNWQLTGEAKLHGLGGHWRDLAMPANEVTARFSADPQRASLHATLSTATQAVVLNAEGMHRFASGEGHAEIKLMPVEFSDAGFVLSHLLAAWPYPFDVNAGRVSATVQVKWQKILTSTLALRLDKLGGHYKTINFSGVSGRMNLAVNNGKATSQDANLRAAVLDVGFPLKNINIQFDLAADTGNLLPVVRVPKASAELLGGRTYIEPFELDLRRDKNTVVVRLDGISLSDIMALEQQEGLQGTGLLDGRVPVTITKQGITVAGGRLAARAPGGVIRYTPTDKVTALAKSNQSVNIIVAALSNYHYTVMDVHSDYQSNGQLNLQVHLEGKNPDWQTGQPLHLNLNLQENISALLRSLQLSDDISERVRKHYQH